MDEEKAKKIVRDAYGKIAQNQGSCGCSCGGPNNNGFAESIGYSAEELKRIPTEANLALSCGNPTALAGLKEGEIVLDLGSGAGFDCFLAASKVGKTGKVIGVDMTPEMVDKARNNARKYGIINVEFRLGEIENLPLDDNSVDAVISNCVINLAPDKLKVFKEMLRVLKPGGRIAISDMALRKELPEAIRKDVDAYIGCVSGAVLLDEYKNIVIASGVKNVRIGEADHSCQNDSDISDPILKSISKGLKENETINDYVTSIYIEGVK